MKPPSDYYNTISFYPGWLSFYWTGDSRKNIPTFYVNVLEITYIKELGREITIHMRSPEGTIITLEDVDITQFRKQLNLAMPYPLQGED